MNHEVRSQNSCEEKCEVVAEKCLRDIYDVASCRIKYNRCRIKCGENR